MGRNDRQLFWGQTRQTTVYGGRKMFIGAYCLLRRCRAVALSFHPVHCFAFNNPPPFPSKENQQIPERDDLGPPVVPGSQGMSS